MQEKNRLMVSWVSLAGRVLCAPYLYVVSWLNHEWVLRVSGSGMKSHCASAPVPPEPLQPVRHGKIKRMNGKRHSGRFPGLLWTAFSANSGT